jgi:hypothetical protein
VIPERPVIAHPPNIILQRAAISRIERVMAHHALQPVYGFIQFMFLITPLIEARFEIE